ncbi:MAG TPA: DinB family protein [Dehalococcoidia bacterium]|nr:DinB family protein [Dehalococcoidia bacterium]
MDSARRSRLLQRYQDAAHAIVVAIDHLESDHLDMRPPKGGWSPREIVHHLANAELMQSVRLRRMLVENTPVLEHWDETQYSRHLHYDRPIKTALEAFRLNAQSNIELLQVLSEREWQREGNQQRMWPLTVESWLEDNVDHIRNRLMQILNATSGGQVLADPS